MLSFLIVRAQIVKKQLKLLKDYDDSNVDKLQRLINEDIYLFEYNDDVFVNSNSNCKIKRFQKDVKMMMKFTVHFVDFIKSKMSDYFFKMQSLYLMNDDIADVIKTFRKRRKADE